MRTLLVIAALVTSPVVALAVEPDLAAAPDCKYCGMDRETYAHSRMHVEYEDGTTTGVCSLRCAAVELALVLDKSPKAVWVGDLWTKKLVEAEKAVWVVGGSKPGVMTKRAKWAFADRAAADAFVKQHGGTVVSFEDAVRAAYEDMHEDSKMIREKRKAKRAAAAAQAAPAQR